MPERGGYRQDAAQNAAVGCPRTCIPERRTPGITKRRDGERCYVRGSARVPRGGHGRGTACMKEWGRVKGGVGAQGRGGRGACCGVPWRCSHLGLAGARVCCGQARLPRHVFAPCVAHDGIGGHGQDRLNQLSDRNADAPVTPSRSVPPAERTAMGNSRRTHLRAEQAIKHLCSSRADLAYATKRLRVDVAVLVQSR